MKNAKRNLFSLENILPFSISHLSLVIKLLTFSFSATIESTIANKKKNPVLNLALKLELIIKLRYQDKLHHVLKCRFTGITLIILNPNLVQSPVPETFIFKEIFLEISEYTKG